MKRKESGKEIVVPYQKIQKELYKKEDPSCIIPMWHGKIGIHRKDGNFAAMVVRKYFEDKGFSVIPDYLLVRCPRKRETNIGFHFLIKCFGIEKITKVISESEKLKLRGGDPDLFVFNEARLEYFFAEAKDTDKVTKNQEVLFPIIENYLCPVIVARIIAQ
jgi:hypothetical protein